MNYKNMKTTLIIALFIFFGLGNFVFAKVPKSWISDQSQFGVFNHTAMTQAAENLNTEEDFNKLFNTGYSVIDPDSKAVEPMLFGNTKKKKKPWYLQSMKAELGIEAEGEIGLVGISGEAAVELIWTRTAYSLQKLQKKHFDSVSAEPLELETEGDTSTLTLETDMSTPAVTSQIDGLVDYVASTRKVSNLNLMRSQLLEKVLESQNMAIQTEQISANATWHPYKYQLELYVSAEGMVAPATMVGGVLRFRFEWKVKPKVIAEPTQVSKLWDDVSPILDKIYMGRSTADDYRLVAVKLGLGFGMKGDIGIAEGKFSVKGSVFMKPNQTAMHQPRQLNQVDLLGSFDVPCDKMAGLPNRGIPFFYSDEKLTHGKTISTSIPKMIFCKSMEKVAAVSGFITRAATKHERKRDLKKPNRNFELGHIELELEISVNGGAFLATVKKMAFAEIFFSKKNKLKN
jgi:hypothetical protein